MRHFTAICTLLFSLLLLPVSSFAWNLMGHMVVAQIAYERLKPEVKAKVDNLIVTFSKEYPDMTQFQQIATWPDLLRYQKIETYTHWHYIDNAISDDGTPLKNLTDTDNAVWAIKQIEPIVGNAKANSCERARFLAFLTHIIGDIHQPLHTVSRISKQHPNGDEGGNLFMILDPTKRPQTMNLHHYWDSGLGLFEPKPSRDDVITLAHTITALYPEKSFGAQVSDLKPEDWSKEGSDIAANVVYKIQENTLPNENYVTSGKQVAEQRVALAGYRLAAVLNELLA